MHIVQQLGGEYSGDLTTDATHLIAGTTGSDKYRVAVELGMHVVQEGWIRACAQRRCKVDEAEHGIRPLDGCVVSATGLEAGTLRLHAATYCKFTPLGEVPRCCLADQREAVRSYVDSFGGRYSGNLEYGVTTHLIARVRVPGARRAAA